MVGPGAAVWFRRTMKQSWTTISQSNNPASVIIRRADARELEAKPSTNVSLSQDNKWRWHEVNLNANVSVKNNKTVFSGVSQTSSSDGGESNKWRPPADWKCVETAMVRWASMQTPNKKKKERKRNEKHACDTCHMKTDGSISRPKPRISKQDSTRITSIDLFLFLEATASNL